MATNFLDGVDLMGCKPGKHHDGEGLFLDVRSATSASWVFKYVLHGKAYELGLGSRKRVDLEAARLKRAWCIGELKAERNPHTTRKDEKLEAVRKANAPKGATVYETARDHVALIAKKLKTDAGRKAWVRSMHADHIGYIADMAPADVALEDVLPLLRSFYTGLDASGKVVRKASPVMADDIRQRLYRVLNWANRRVAGYENPCRWEGNLENEINREHVEANHAALDFDKVGGFLAGLRAKDTSDLRMRLALEWNVISQTRAGEAAGTDWSEIDAANDCWAIPPERMKMRRRHRVPLTARHHEILDLILDGAPQPVRGPVFSLDGKNPVSVTGLRKMMQAVAAPGVTLHGFRSAFATWARSETYEVILPGSGERRRIRLYDEAMIEESLAHVVGGKVRTAYVRDDFLELRRPLQEAWAAYCGVVQAAKVVPIRRAIKVAA